MSYLSVKSSHLSGHCTDSAPTLIQLVIVNQFGGAVFSGSTTASSVQVVSNSSGEAQVVATLGATVGTHIFRASASGATFLAKSLDESVLLPKDCAGRKIRVQGVVTMMPAKDAEAHQHADHAAAGHECPAPTYLISTQGAELVAVKKK